METVANNLVQGALLPNVLYLLKKPRFCKTAIHISEFLAEVNVYLRIALRKHFCFV